VRFEVYTAMSMQVMFWFHTFERYCYTRWFCGNQWALYRHCV